LLVPAVGVGADEALLSLRVRCAAAVASLLALAPEVIVVLGAGDAEVLDEAAGGSFAPWGLDVRVGAPGVRPQLSLPLAVGAWLLDDGGWRGPRRYLGVGSGVRVRVDLERWALLVIADGSASRSDKAPASFHPDAQAFDASVARALASGSGDALAAIDAQAGMRVLAAGVPAWPATADLIAGAAYEAEVIVDIAPYGVGYFVALWTART
jgi:hypothetical protein